MQSNYDYQVKIVLIGECSPLLLLGSQQVGKSNILSRFVRNTFDLESKTTVGVEFGSRDIVVDANVIRLQLWDTAGQEKFQSITQGFYRNAAGVFLIYDITRKESFDEIPVPLSIPTTPITEVAQRVPADVQPAHQALSPRQQN